MATYIVSYDLCAPGRDYQGLYDAIKSFPGWGKLTESTWAIVTENTAVQIRDFLAQHMDTNDRLIVIKSANVAAWRRVMASNEWVKKNI